MSHRPLDDAASITTALERACTWDEAQDNLGALKLHMRPLILRGGGVYVTDRAERQRPISDFWEGGVPDLNSKYRETFRQFSERLVAPLARATGISAAELLRKERH
jgi:hypothetical protein